MQLPQQQQQEHQQQQFTDLGDDKKLVFSSGHRKSPFFSRIIPSQLHLEQLRWHDYDLKERKWKKSNQISIMSNVIFDIVKNVCDNCWYVHKEYFW